MIPEMIFTPFFTGFGLLMLLGVALTLYVLYDVFVNQEEMELVEKLIWVAAVLVLHLLGVIAYLVIVKSKGYYLLDELPAATGERIGDLERLRRLKESGTLTEAEFEAEKQRILDRE